MAFCTYSCPCGYYGDQVKECSYAASMITRYQKRISGPLLDRIAIHIEVPRVEYQELAGDRMGEPSAATRSRCPGGRSPRAAGVRLRKLGYARPRAAA